MNKWESSTAEDDCTFTTPLPSQEILTSFPRDTTRVLDLGCGYGRVLKHMYKMGYRDLTGIDVSAELIARAKQSCPDAIYHIQDIERIQLEQRYDLILVMGVIEYILSDQDQKVFLDKVSKSLNPNGHVLLETFVMDCANWRDYVAGYIHTLHWGRFRNSKGFECHHQSISKLMEILVEHFEIVQATRECYMTWSGNNCNGLTVILKAH